MSVELMTRARSHDVSGFGVFSQGDAGVAHVMAHRMLDEARYELGHQLLGAWLDCHRGAGSDWTHLQWHMGVFEFAVGEWEKALARFEREIMPVATGSDDALTDAPAMLWRLWLNAPRAVALPWEPVRATAIRNLGRHACPYVELHCLLALAGARDIETLDEWLRVERHSVDERTRLLAELAWGLRALATCDYALAAAVLHRVVPSISELGGSHAQNLLFKDLAEHCWQRAQIRTAA